MTLDWWLPYVLGIFTPFVVCGIVIFLWWAFEPQEVTQGCLFCRDIGFSDRTTHTRLGYYLGHLHHNLRARTNYAHRVEWQKHLDARKRRGSKGWEELAAAQGKYGIK